MKTGGESKQKGLVLEDPEQREAAAPAAITVVRGALVGVPRIKSGLLTSLVRTSGH